MTLVHGITPSATQFLFGNNPNKPTSYYVQGYANSNN